MQAATCAGRPDEEAQALIIGAPLLLGNLPGQLKVMSDRIVYGMMGGDLTRYSIGLHKGKKAIIVSTCTTPYPFNIFFNQTRRSSKNERNPEMERL